MNRKIAISEVSNRHFSKKWWIVTSFTLLIVSVAAGLLLGLPQANFAHAASASIVISPSGRAYAPPDSLIGVSGSGFAAHETVNIYWNYTGPGTGTLEASPATNVSGSFASIYFVTPHAHTGTYTIAAVGQTSGSVATGTFNLLPGLSADPPAAGINTSIQINGDDFGAGETVSVYWNYVGPTNKGKLLKTATGDSFGSFVVNAIVPVGSTPNLINLAGVGKTSGTVALYRFTHYPPTLALAPLQGPAGTNLTLSAYGFKGGEGVKLFWNNSTTSFASATTDIHGYMDPQNFTVPSGSANGAYPVKIVGQTSHLAATNTYTVGPLLAGTHSAKVHAAGTANWPDWGLGAALHRENTSETTLSTSTVAGLQLKWSQNIGTNNLGSASPVEANGVVYMTTTDGKLDAFNATTGAVVWQYDPKTKYPNLGSALVDLTSNTVFYGSLAHQAPGTPSPFYGIDLTTGQLKWSVILRCNEFSFPTLAFNTVYIGTSLQTDSSGRVYALDAATGHMNWQQQTVGGVWTGIGVDVNAHTVFAVAGDPGFTLNAYDALTGAALWTMPVPNSTADQDVGSGVEVGNNGMLYISSKNGYVYGVDENSHTVTWTQQIAKISQDDVSTPVLGSNGLLYVGSRDAFLYILNPSTGAVVQKVSNVGAIDSTPAIANGVVYFGSFNNKFYAMDETTGTILWSYTTGNRSYSSPIVVNGWLYNVSSDGKLYAFSL